MTTNIPDVEKIVKELAGIEMPTTIEIPEFYIPNWPKHIGVVEVQITSGWHWKRYLFPVKRRIRIYSSLSG